MVKQCTRRVVNLISLLALPVYTVHSKSRDQSVRLSVPSTLCAVQQLPAGLLLWAAAASSVTLSADVRKLNRLTECSNITGGVFVVETQKR